MIKLTWDDVEKMTDELTAKVKSSGFAPDHVIGIAAGGLIPLYFFAKKLGVKSILTVSAASYEKDKKKELTIMHLPETDLRRKNILLIDEIADTGETLKEVSNIIVRKYQPQELKTITLAINKERCTFTPDLFSIATSGEWVVFPWEKTEFPEYF